MHIFEQPDTSARANDLHRPGNFVVPAPVASVAHVSESDHWNPLLPSKSSWIPRDRRATHRAMGKH